LIISKLENGEFVRAGTITLVDGKAVLTPDEGQSLGFFKAVRDANDKTCFPSDGQKYINALKERFGHSKTIAIEEEEK
jgi:hypothetical protein